MSGKKGFPGFGQKGHEVARDEAGLGVLGGGQIAGEAVQIDAQQAGFKRRIALGQQSGEEAGEYIAAAASGHARVTCAVEPADAVGASDAGVSAFEDEVNAQFLCFGALQRVTLEAVGRRAKEPFELFGVWRQDRGRRQVLEPLFALSQDVERVGIEH